MYILKNCFCKMHQNKNSYSHGSGFVHNYFFVCIYSNLQRNRMYWGLPTPAHFFPHIHILYVKYFSIFHLPQSFPPCSYTAWDKHMSASYDFWPWQRTFFHTKTKILLPLPSGFFLNSLYWLLESSTFAYKYFLLIVSCSVLVIDSYFG